MAISLDIGPLPVDPENAATLLAAIFNTDAAKITAPFETMKLTTFTVTVTARDNRRLVFRVRSEGGMARIMIQLYHR